MTEEQKTKPDGRINAQQLKYAKRLVFCYGWWRQSSQRYLYIGQTTAGFKRLQTHNIIGRGIDFEPLDEIHFWYPVVEIHDDYVIQAHYEAIEVAAMEKILIELHKPELNCNEMGVHRTKRVCKFCEKEFPANRPWQEFCSKKCRESHWQNKPKEEKGVLKICAHCKKQYTLLVIELNHDKSFLCSDCRGK